MLVGCLLVGLRYGAPQRWLAVTASWLIAVTGVLTLVVAIGFSMIDSLGPQRAVYASSDRYQLIRYDYGIFGAEHDFRVVRRDGLLSREGRTDVACFLDDDYHTVDSWHLDRAAFTGSTEITFTPVDGPPLIVRFDPRTLAPLAFLDRCTNPPPPAN